MSDTEDVIYRMTSETHVVHKDGCRYARSSLTWPHWPGRHPRPCSLCLPDGLPEWEHDPQYPGMGVLK